MRVRFSICVMVSVVMILSATAFAYMVDSTKATRSVQGNAVSVDWVGSKLVLKVSWGGNADEMTFTVAEDAQITRGGDPISLDDILQNDPLTVTYYNASPGPLLAVRITDSNDANR